MKTYTARFRILEISYNFVFMAAFAVFSVYYYSRYGFSRPEMYLITFGMMVLLMYSMSLIAKAGITINEKGDIASVRTGLLGKRYDFSLNVSEIERFEVSRSNILPGFWEKYDWNDYYEWTEFGTSLHLINKKYPRLSLPIMNNDFYERLLELRPDAAPAVEKLHAQFKKEVRFFIVGYALFLILLVLMVAYFTKII